MGTTWSVKLAVPEGWSNSDVRRGVVAELDRVIDQMSTWKADSSISRFNRAAPGTWQSLEDEFFTVVEAALACAALSGGAYDPTVGAAVDLWGFGPDARHRTIPRPPLSRRRASTSDGLASRSMPAGGVFCSPAKFASISRRSPRASASIRLRAICAGPGLPISSSRSAASLRGEGVKPDGTPWFVELEHPPQADGNSARGAEALIALHGLSVATSGDYRRTSVWDGRIYSHTIDPRTAAPVDHALASVTVVAESCMTADALATALMVLGPGPALGARGKREHCRPIYRA